MPEMKSMPVSELSLDLKNFRTLPQANEDAAIRAMISTRPEQFWALTQSLLKDGYLPTENIIVLRGATEKDNTVKEGNRRIAALKFILGQLELHDSEIPPAIAALRTPFEAARQTDTQSVPCTIYAAADGPTVDRIVTLAHGKGEKAARDQWNAVARARHNRDAKSGSEAGLDLLEKYLKNGKNITGDEKQRWAGDYPLTVLDEATGKLASRLGFPSSSALAAAYPAIKERDSLESMLHDIGQKKLGFEGLRSKQTDFAAAYGLPVSPVGGGATASTAAGAGGSAQVSTPAAGKPSAGPAAVPTSDPKAVKRAMRKFRPKGSNREKLEELRIEATRLDLAKTPLAFTFVLRSMLEISAKAYCADHAQSSGPQATKADGSDRKLVDVLRDVTGHLTKQGTDRVMEKLLHGALTELAIPDGLLSVTSMNQLVHNPHFSVSPGDVAIRFGRVFPLLEQMNR
jgi:hypothetical protein